MSVMKKLITKLAVVLAMCGLLFVAPMALAQTNSTSTCTPTTVKQALQCGSGNSAGVKNGADSERTLTDLITKIINLTSVVVAVVAVIMIMVGGLRYVTSAGKADSAASAKNTIMYALIGLVVVALGQIVVHFVLTNLNDVTNVPPPKP